MDDKYNPNLIPLAKELRKNMTKEEKHLWYDFLNRYPVKFTRQKVLGKYIADFYCAKAKLVVELDGSEHYSEQGKANDAARTLFLAEYGIEVIRINNLEIHNNFQGVCDFLNHYVQKRLQSMAKL